MYIYTHPMWSAIVARGKLRLNILKPSYQYTIPIIKIRWSYDSIVFMTGITRHGKTARTRTHVCSGVSALNVEGQDCGIKHIEGITGLRQKFCWKEWWNSNSNFIAGVRLRTLPNPELKSLKYWNREKWPHFTYSLWMKIAIFLFEFHRNLLLRVQLIIHRH